MHVTTKVPEIMEGARLLAAAFEWNGPLHFNFFLDRDGRYLLADCNPRVWGSTELAVAAGVNVCQQAVDVMVLGRRLEPRSDYRVGLASKWITPGTVQQCLRKPRTPRAIFSRVASLVDPRQPSVSNLRLGNFRHLATIVLDTAERRGRRKASALSARRRGLRIPVFRDQPEEHAVDPAAVAPVGLPADALPREARALRMPHRRAR